MEDTNLQTPPIDYPKVSVGGVPCLMRFTSASLMLLTRWGVDVALMNDSRRRIEVALACLGNYDKRGRWIPIHEEDPLTLVGNLLEGELKTILDGFAPCMAKVAPPTKAESPAAVANEIPGIQ